MAIIITESQYVIKNRRFFTVKHHSLSTKTTCFGIVMLSDTFLRSITLTNMLTLNMLETKVTLSPKTALRRVQPRRRSIRHYELPVLPLIHLEAG